VADNNNVLDELKRFTKLLFAVNFDESFQPFKMHQFNAKKTFYV
jgi:hypothetical protein